MGWSPLILPKSDISWLACLRCPWSGRRLLYVLCSLRRSSRFAYRLEHLDFLTRSWRSRPRRQWASLGRRNLEAPDPSNGRTLLVGSPLWQWAKSSEASGFSPSVHRRWHPFSSSCLAMRIWRSRSVTPKGMGRRTLRSSTLSTSHRPCGCVQMHLSNPLWSSPVPMQWRLAIPEIVSSQG